MVDTYTLSERGGTDTLLQYQLLDSICVRMAEDSKITGVSKADYQTAELVRVG